MHPSIQLLIAVSGTGLVQLMGKPALMLSARDSVIIYPNEEHWHGTSADGLFTHQAIQLTDDQSRLSGPSQIKSMQPSDPNILNSI